MKYLSLWLIGCLWAAAAVAGTPAATNAPVPIKCRLITEHLPPLSYVARGEPTGLAVEIVKAIMARLNQAGRIEVRATTEAYALAQADKPVALFPMGLMPERQAEFKWVGPIGKTELSFYARKGSGLTVNNWRDARAVRFVAVIKKDARADELEQRGFSNLVYVADNQEGLRLLLRGSVDLMPLDNNSIGYMLKECRATLADVERKYTYSVWPLYIAFSRATPDALVGAWRQALTDLKKNGDYARLYAEWLPTQRSGGGWRTDSNPAAPTPGKP